MTIIGIISTNQRFEILKNIIQKNSNKNEITLININRKSIENLKTVKFDIIVLMDFLEKFEEQVDKIEEICESIKYLIINSDIEQNHDIFINIKSNIITCGLNQKSTVTFSSITDENMLISIQRGFRNKEGKLIEVGEYSIKINPDIRTKLNEILVAFIIENLEK